MGTILKKKKVNYSKTLTLTDAYLCFEKFENLLGPVQVVWGHLVRQSEADGFQLNESKCKELRISFSRSGSSVDHITINDKQIEVVSSANAVRSGSVGTTSGGKRI